MSVTMATTQTSAESMCLQQKSELVNKYALELSSAFQYSSAVRSALFIFAQHFFRINHAVFSFLVFGGTVAALQTYLITKDLTMRSTAALARLASTAWNSKQSRRLQKKVEFEFFVLILGCGNSFCLVVFWPGWILIGLVYLLWTVLRCWAG
ncbi:hypothetical protein VM1G_10244 [Cytospora mali]|uniref:Uncharacterized protein n=2 Tax=Cytospora mali TaxID=578113 RepID=A0ACD6AY19_CYTMA|nr:hypothetical protein VP1G_01945 [Valsa mali var. pyri (nom. inval.)]KUI63428.1 hypothetical protein VM1G_10244 [Valsa mali]